MCTATRTSRTGITKVNANDIICGRGGLALKHPGNMAYRKMVGLNKELYATCLKTEKLGISKSIVAAIRETKVRFLERQDGKTGQYLEEKDEYGNPVTWKDIGDKRAIEKTSQALREGRPKLLRKLSQLSELVRLGDESQQYKVQSCHVVGDSVQVQVSGHQPPVQNTFQAKQRPSFTSVSSVDGQTFETVPAENSLHIAQYSQPRLDSWGSEDPAPLLGVERSDSKSSRVSWGVSLPYQQGANNSYSQNANVSYSTSQARSSINAETLLYSNQDGRVGEENEAANAMLAMYAGLY